MSTRRLRDAAAALILAAACSSPGCSSSLVIPEESELVYVSDGGIEGLVVLDATDNRRLPSECFTAEECDDRDPCTDQDCVQGRCRFTMKEIGLRAIPFETSQAALDVSLAPGLLYVAEGEFGVEAYDIGDPATPVFFRKIETEGAALAIDSNEMGLVVMEGESGLETFSSSNFRQLTRVLSGQDALEGVEEVVEIGIGPRFSIAAAYSRGISVINVTSFGAMAGVSQVDTPGRAVSAASDSETCGLVADSLGGALAVLFQSEEGPVISGEVQSDGRVVDVDVRGDTALLAEYGAGFGVVDLSDPDNPERLAMAPSPTPSVSVSLIGPQTGVVAEESGRLVVYGLLDPLSPTVLAEWNALSKPLDMDAHQGMVAVALGAEGAALLLTGCEESGTDSDPTPGY